MKNQTRAQTLLPFLQHQSITLATSLGRSDFNALDIRVQKRFSKDVMILAAYTWSSNWDDIWGAYGSSNTLNSGNNGPQDVYNLFPEYARATNDIPNRFIFAGSWELPARRGKRFLGNVNRFANEIVEGWRFHDVMIVQKKSPLAITQTSNLTSYGNNTQRLTIIPGVSPCKSGSLETRILQHFNPLAFAVTPPPVAGGGLPYGNQPCASNCYGPGYINTDLSLNKKFRLSERVHAELCAEALNAFDTSQFSTPALSIGSCSTTANSTSYNSGAGKITGTLGFPRLVQLGGQLTF